MPDYLGNLKKNGIVLPGGCLQIREVFVIDVKVIIMRSNLVQSKVEMPRYMIDLGLARLSLVYV